LTILFEKNHSQVFEKVNLELLKVLKRDKENTLAVEDNSWRLKSRAIWLHSSDKNTNFFHKFTTMRRTQNMIWDIEDEVGNLHSFDQDFKKIAYNHFKNQFSPIASEDIRNQLEVLAHLPKFFTDTDCVEIGKVVLIDEVRDTINKMPKDKIPGSDGWIQELFQYFFEILGDDLLMAIEESKITGFIPSSLNATFYAPIPKVSKPGNFHEFMPIALCNFIYKLI
jgi:hypothetical protein